MSETLSPAQLDVEELRAEAVTPEDHEAVDAWHREVTEERALALESLTNAVALHNMGDGTIATDAEAQAVVDGEADHSGAYDGGGRA